MLVYDVWYPVESHPHDRQTQGEEKYELYLSLDRHPTCHNDGNREDDEQKVGNDVADRHGKKLYITLTALTARIG